jgi:hypothetical protein
LKFTSTSAGGTQQIFFFPDPCHATDYAISAVVGLRDAGSGEKKICCVPPADVDVNFKALGRVMADVVQRSRRFARCLTKHSLCVWPPVWTVETPFTGVADDRLALTPSVEQMFSHALPGQFTGP